MASVRKRRWLSKGAVKTAWIVDYTDNGGRRRQRTFSLKKRADSFLFTLQSELADGSHVPAGESITVREACQLWLTRAEREGLERSTYEDYEQVSRLHIIPLIGSFKLNDLTKLKVENFRDELLTTRSYDRAKRALLHLKMTLTEAVRVGRISKNVAADVTIKERGRHKEPVTILTVEELNLFLDAAEALGNEANAFANLISFQGLRASEIRGLPWKYVNLDAGTIYIGQRADKWCKVGVPKSKKSRRFIPLTPSTAEALRAWREESGGEGFVFQHPSQRPYNYGELVELIFDPIMFAAGLTKERENGTLTRRYSLHPFRHTTASIWIEQGFSPKRICQLMGHSSIQVTFDLYGHLIDLKHSADDLMRQLEKSVRRRRTNGTIVVDSGAEPDLFEFAGLGSL
jgi:integrase